MEKLLKINEIKQVGTKYLSEVINIEKLLEHETSLIISNCGSGKTQMVFKELIPHFDKDKVLYLCDTSNLVNAITTSNEKYNCTINNENIMTYAKASYIAQGDNENKWLTKYDLIVCDEVHSLVNYDSKYINRLQKILEYVTMKHENTKIVMLTATPFYFDVYCNKYNLHKKINRLDFRNNEELFMYYNKRIGYIKNYTQSNFILYEYREYFANGGKCLIFTDYIENMKQFEELCLHLGLRPILIWSKSNKEKPMDEEQLKVLNHLIETGNLLDPYNVLIINQATESGIDITDKNVGLCICNTLNKTSQVQARGRIRGNIDFLCNRNEHEETYVYIPHEYMNTPLTTDLKNELIEKLEIRENNKLIKFPKLKELAEKCGYEFKDKRTRINEKQLRVTIITRKE